MLPGGLRDQVDLSTALILGAVVLLEGVRRVPPGALLLRRAPGGAGFQVVEAAPGVRLASWAAPLVTTVLVPPAPEAAPDRARLRARLQAVATLRPALTLLGLLAVLGLVAGIPLALAWAGTRGLLGALGGLLLVAVEAVLLLGHGYARLGHGTGGGLGKAAGMLSPFAVPRAWELLLEEALRGASPALVAEALLAPEALRAWLRPRLHDARAAGLEDPVLETLVPRAEWPAWLAAVPAGHGGGPWCQRCGTEYREGTATCAGCGVELSSGRGSSASPTP